MIYKYLPIERVDVIRDLVIRFSPLRSLNDPFESKPLVDTSAEIDTSDEEAIRGFNSETIVDENGKIVTLEEFKKILAETRHDHEQLFGVNSAGGDLINKVGDSFGVLSLSRTKRNLLMWSHYASQGKGYVLSFDTTHQFFNKLDQNGISRGLRPITYSTERSVVRASDEYFYEKLFCRKPLEWHYEEEERIFCIYDPDVPVEGVDEFGLKIRLSDLPREAITGIYLGYNSDQEFLELIADAVQKNKIECPLYKGTISKNQYRVLFEEISI